MFCKQARFLLGCSEYFFKYLRFVFGKVGENLAVQFYPGFFKKIYQFAVADAVFPGGGVDFNLPQTSKITFFLFPVGKLKTPGMKQGLLGLAIFGFASPQKTLRVFQKPFASFVPGCSSFDSGHDKN